MDGCSICCLHYDDVCCPTHPGHAAHWLLFNWAADQRLPEYLSFNIDTVINTQYSEKSIFSLLKVPTNLMLFLPLTFQAGMLGKLKSPPHFKVPSWGDLSFPGLKSWSPGGFKLARPSYRCSTKFLHLKMGYEWLVGTFNKENGE